jgi:hypothetical protein
MTVQSDNLVPCRKVVTSNADLRAVLVWLVTSFGKDGPAYQHQQCGKPAYRDVADQELPTQGASRTSANAGAARFIGRSQQDQRARPPAVGG